MNKHCLLDTPSKVMVNINSSSVQNIKNFHSNNLSISTFMQTITKFLKLLSKIDKKNISVTDIKELQRGITIDPCFSIAATSHEYQHLC